MSDLYAWACLVVIALACALLPLTWSKCKKLGAHLVDLYFNRS